MHTVELLEQAIEAAKRLGFHVRQDWLGGSAGGSCEIRGKKWIFVDLALSPLEQFGQVADAIRHEAAMSTLALSPALRRALRINSAA